MKYCICLLLASASAIRYNESEGPTKVDYGENDDDITKRIERDRSDWTNPLGWRDHGEDDDVVVLQTDGSQMMLRKIYDEDGDGVEDNVHKTYDELDRFYWPNRFNAAEEIYNTHHGNLPGHVRAEEYEAAPKHPTRWFYEKKIDPNAGADKYRYEGWFNTK